MKQHVLIVAPGEAVEGEVGTGTYIEEAFEELGWTVDTYDYRACAGVLGQIGMNQELLTKVRADVLDIGFILVLKGELLKDLTYSIMSNLRTVALWDFDSWRAKDQSLLDRAEQCDFFFTIAKGLIPWYQEKGINAHWLSEACSPKYHQRIPNVESPVDIGFIGTVEGIPGRAETLRFLVKEGLKPYLWGSYPGEIVDTVHYAGRARGDVGHNWAVSKCKLTLGMDRTPEISGSWSARLYRTLAAGGVYLTNHTAEIEHYFEDGRHLYTYIDQKDLISRVKEILEDGEARAKVSEAGRRLVLSEHTFTNRIRQMLSILEE